MRRRGCYGGRSSFIALRLSRAGYRVQHSYFGHDEYAPFAPGLKTIADADHLRNRILGAFENCERTLDPKAHPELLTFVIVGAGPTGVELVGAIAELARLSLASEFRRFDPTSLRILLVEAGPRILPPFHESLGAAAKAKLEKLGVEVRTGGAVEKVDADGVVIKGERINSKNVFWAAGVKPSPAAKWLGAEATGPVALMCCPIAQFRGILRSSWWETPLRLWKTESPCQAWLR